MTNDRHLALMTLMRQIAEPSKAYQRSVRLAGALGSDTPQWDSAVEKGKAALDLIEQAVRAWVAAHPEPGPLSDLERARSIAVALEQENAQQTERLTAIHKLADALEDYLPGNTWHLANTITRLAKNEITAAEALTEDGAE